MILYFRGPRSSYANKRRPEAEGLCFPGGSRRACLRYHKQVWCQFYKINSLQLNRLYIPVDAGLLDRPMDAKAEEQADGLPLH
jgi:hypothetical protein